MENQPAKTVETQQSPVVVKDKMKSRPAVVVLSALLMLALLATGILGYLYVANSVKIDELGHDKSDLSKQIESLEASLSKADNNPYIGNADLTDAERLQRQRDNALLAAGVYYCNIKDFGCDKVSSSISKFQAPSVTAAGFAIVKADRGEGGTNFYLRTQDGIGWVVIYDGQNAPPQEIVDKFEIPKDFAS